MLKIMHNLDNKSREDFVNILSPVVDRFKGNNNFQGFIVDGNYNVFGILSETQNFSAILCMEERVMNIPKLDDYKYRNLLEYVKHPESYDFIKALEDIIYTVNSISSDNIYCKPSDFILCYFLYD